MKQLIPLATVAEAYVVHGTSIARIVIKYVIDRSPKGSKDLLVQAAQQLPNTLRGEIMTIAQQWKEEGVQKGVQQSMQRLFQKRFGSLSSAYIQRIENADAETLLRWGEKLLDAKTLEEVFEEH